MFILSILNAIIILLVNSLRIEDAIIAYYSSDFSVVFLISVFLLSVDIIAILIILDVPYSKYLYPVELVLYFFCLQFLEIRFQRCENYSGGWFEASQSEPSVFTLPAEDENIMTGPVKKYAKFKIPGQNLITRAEISAFFKGDFDHPQLAEIKAVAIEPRKFEISFPFVFFYDRGLSNRAGIEYGDMSVKVADISVSESEIGKEIKVKCVLDYSYKAFISRLCGYAETAVSQESESVEVSYSLARGKRK